MFGITSFKSFKYLYIDFVIVLLLHIVIYDINDISTRHVSFVIVYLIRARPFLVIVHCMHYKERYV